MKFLCNAEKKVTLFSKIPEVKRRIPLQSDFALTLTVKSDIIIMSVYRMLSAGGQGFFHPMIHIYAHGGNNTPEV